MTKTERARRAIYDVLESLQIAKKLSDSERERIFTIQLVRHLEALKRSHTASEGFLATRIERFVIARDYDAAVQAWEGRR